MDDEAKTTYYKTVAEWKAAGSPVGTEVERVVIGTSPPEPAIPSEPTIDTEPIVTEASQTSEQIQTLLEQPGLSAAQRAVLEAKQRELAEQAVAPPPAEDTTAREQQLQEAIEYSEKLAKGEVPIPEGGIPEDYWRSIEDIRAKQEILQKAKEVEESFKRAGMELTPEAEQYIEQARAIAASPAAPFIQISPEGKIELVGKLTTAEKAGVSLAEFEKLGFTSEELATIKGQEQEAARQREISRELSKYPDLATAIREGKIDLVREAAEMGVIPKLSVVEAQIAAADTELKRQSLEQLKDYIDAGTGGLRIRDAINAGMDASVMRNAGYDVSQEAYDFVKAEVEKPTVELPLEVQQYTDQTIQQLQREYLKNEGELNKLIDRVWAENPDKSPEEKAEIVEQSQPYKDYRAIEQAVERHKGTLSDVIAEGLSFGQVQTMTFNKDEIEKQYENQVAISLTVANNDAVELKRLYDNGTFGERRSEEAIAAFNDSLNIIRQQKDLEDAVSRGDLEKIESLYNEGAFGDDVDNYLEIYNYVKDGGRVLGGITPQDLEAIKNSFGAKEQYVQDVVEAQPANFELAKGIGIAMIPIYGTIYYWDDMSAGWKAGSIVLDVLTFVPFFGGIAAAAKVSAGVGRSARIMAGLKVVPRIALAEIKAPYTAIRHPLNTVKTVGGEIRKLGEWLLHPRQIPFNTASTTYGTVRLDVDVVGSPEAAMYIRDELMRLQAAGKEPRLIFAGKEYRLRETFLMKGGGVVTASPDIAWIGKPGGALVEPKVYPLGHPKAGQLMGKSEQGLFVANEALERFTASSAFGLEKIGQRLEDNARILMEQAKVARNAGDVKLASKLENLSKALAEASELKDTSKMGKIELEVTKALDDVRANKILDAIYDSKTTASQRYRIGDISGAQEVMDEALFWELTLEKKPGFAVFSPDVSVYAVPSGKVYPGMVFQPEVGEFWAILVADVKQDKAARLLMQADEYGKIGNYEKAAELTYEAKELMRSGQSGFKRLTTAEMEMKFPEYFRLPEMEERYFTRGGLGQKLSIFTDKPMDFKTRIKTKLLAPIETIKQMYSPAISVKSIPMTDAQVLSKIDDLLREAGRLEEIGEVAKAKVLRMEAGILGKRISNITSMGEAVEASRTVDQADSYIQAGQKAEAFGDTVSADRLIREAEAIRVERLAGIGYMEAVARRAGTVLGVLEEARLLGFRPEGYRKIVDSRMLERRIPELERRVVEPELRIFELERRIVSERILETREPKLRELEISEPEIREIGVREYEVRLPEYREVEIREPEIREPEIRRPTIREPEYHEPEERVPTPLPYGVKEKQEKIAKIQPGTVVWIQGRPLGRGGRENVAMYKLLPPPYRQEDFFTMRETPLGYVDEGWSGKGMAKKSLQVIGGLPESNIENIDLGWTRININVEGGKPEIEYVHDVEANVGERSQTVGMGKGQIPIEAWEEAKAQGISYEDFVNSYRGGLVGESTKTEEATEPSTPISEPELEAEPVAHIESLEPAGDSERTVSEDEAMQDAITESPPIGTIVWKDQTAKGDEVYRVSVPPYGEDNTFSTQEVLRGYSENGEVDAFKTLQVLGGSLPDRNEVDVGVAMAQMVNGDIVFTRKVPAEAYRGGNYMTKQRQTVEVRDGTRYVYREIDVIPTGVSKAQKEIARGLYQEAGRGEAREDRRKRLKSELEGAVGSDFASSGGQRKVDEMLDTFAGVESPSPTEAGQEPIEAETEEIPIGSTALSKRMDAILGLDILDEKMPIRMESAEAEGEEPYQVIQSYIRRKKPKNFKDWWESPYYNIPPMQPARRKQPNEAEIGERTYLGHRLLPPELGGEI